MLKERYSVRLPESHPGTLDQDEEYFYFEDRERDTSEKVRFHDYGDIYKVPGLYEHLFYKTLKCGSPAKVCGMLKEAIEEAARKGNGSPLPDHITDPSRLRVLDLGAGNGIVGEHLRNLGAGVVHGLDIEPEAKEALDRDRPGLYDKYFVADMTNPPADVRRDLEEASYNCMTSVAALGFGDIPPEVFGTGFNLVATPGWIAFNIKEDFLDPGDGTGFAGLVKRMIREGKFEVYGQEHYRHRIAFNGDPLHYVAIVGQKRGDIPPEWYS